MANAATLSEIPVVDTDSHVSEPPDLWTSRVAAKYRDRVPVVEKYEKTGLNHWRIDGEWLTTTGQFAWAGSEKYMPESMFTNLEDADPGSWNPVDRLTRMDEYGIHAQVLYPNLIGFEPTQFMKLGLDMSVMCTEIYNDFLLEFASTDPKRLIPIAMLPFWDLDATLKEIKRIKEAGHKGVLFANKLDRLQMPPFTDEFWDPLYALCQDLELPINFHIGFGGTVDGVLTEEFASGWMKSWNARQAAAGNAYYMMSNGECIVNLIASGLADRFPRLPFVSVESGMGYLPYLIESLDWHWKGYGAHRDGGPMPSEVFRRQCYGTFWFEKGTLGLLEQYPDNFMFETDYPHPTSMSPGPTSPAVLVKDHIAEAFANVPLPVARKALHDNAARIYQID